MAVTKILPIRSTIQKSVDYICNPDKVGYIFDSGKNEGGLLIHSEHCVPQMAGQIFHHHLNQCRAGGNTIGRHLIQSFAPGEVDPATAHEIGKRLAEEILGGRYAYVLATHVDRGHVHNHFIWGAADIISHKRYRSNKTTYHEIRNTSDRLCKEHELSVIVPQGVGKSYAEWGADINGTSWKAKLKTNIDKTISSSASFEDFIKRMEEQGYTIKRGKHTSFKAPDQERFTRAKRLGAEYTEEETKNRIAKSRSMQLQKMQSQDPQSQNPAQTILQQQELQQRNRPQAPQQSQSPQQQKPSQQKPAQAQPQISQQQKSQPQKSAQAPPRPKIQTPPRPQSQKPQSQKLPQQKSQQKSQAQQLQKSQSQKSQSPKLPIPLGGLCSLGNHYHQNRCRRNIQPHAGTRWLQSIFGFNGRQPYSP